MSTVALVKSVAPARLREPYGTIAALAFVVLLVGSVVAVPAVTVAVLDYFDAPRAPLVESEVSAVGYTGTTQPHNFQIDDGIGNPIATFSSTDTTTILGKLVVQDEHGNEVTIDPSLPAGAWLHTRVGHNHR